MDKEKLIAEIKAMSVLELFELVKALEEEFGVSAAATAVAVAGPAVAAEEVEEKTEFDVVLKDAGPKKIDVIKVIRTLTNLGLVEAKAMSETAGAKVLSAVGKEAAADAKSKLEAAGAVVELA